MDTVKIKGMSCQHCVGSVKKALESIPGISQVNVDLEGAKATFENSGVSESEIKSAITNIGFEPVE